MSLPRLLPALALLALLAGCGRHEHSPAGGGGHVHQAPHGGTLIEIGAHAYNLELLRDPVAGKLTAWVLDGHAENFVRIKAPELAIEVTTGGEKRPLVLKAVANAATGETAGDSSQFEAAAEWLKSAGELTVAVPAIEIRGTRFEKLGAKLTSAAGAAKAAR